jgi:hypothetical protein
VVLWKIDDDYNMVPGTQQTLTFQQTTWHKQDSETFYRTDKITPIGGFGKYAINLQRTDNSGCINPQAGGDPRINIRTNVVHPTDTLVRVKVRATENALAAVTENITPWSHAIPSATTCNSVSGLHPASVALVR